MKNKNRLLIGLLAMVMLLGGIVIPGGMMKAEAAELNVGVTTTMPTADQIRSFYRNYKTTATKTKDIYGVAMTDDSNMGALYKVSPDIATKERGVLADSVKNDVIHSVNTMRYSVGLGSVKADNTKHAYAQAATLVLSANGTLTHYPETPAGMKDTDLVVIDGKEGASKSNLFYGGRVHSTAEIFFKDDIGTRNREMVGHRRWLMLPTLETVGVGYIKPFGALYVLGSKIYGPDVDDMVVPYPGNVGISEWMSKTTPLSLHLGRNFDIANATVKVTDLVTGEVHNFSGSTLNKNDEILYGGQKTLTFGEGLNYAPGASYRVVVNGLRKNGSVYPVAYNINYSSILGSTEETVVKTEKRKVTNPFSTLTYEDPNLEEGKELVVREGRDETIEITEKVTYVNGKEVKREEVSRKVIQASQSKMIAIGTKEPIKEPVITTKTEVQQLELPYQMIEKEDPTLLEGSKKVSQAGSPGLKEITYEITLEDGKEVSRKVIKEEVIKQPVNQITLVGTKKAPVIETKEETRTEVIDFPIIEQSDSTLPVGSAIIKQEGTEGLRTIVESVKYVDGIEESRTVISDKITKQPTPMIMVIGTKDAKENYTLTETTKVNIPFKTITKEDPGMFKGESKIVQDGKVGVKEVAVEVLYDPDGVEISRRNLKEIIVANPVDKIVAVGTKEKGYVLTHTEMEEMPFETIEKDDPNLSEGETKVIQEGKVGTKEVVVEVHFDGNDKEIDRKVIGSKVITEPVNKIISIGTKKSTEETPEKPVVEVKKETVEEAVPFETVETKVTTTKEGETKIVQKGKDGVKKVVYEVVLEDGVEVSRKVITEEVTVKPTSEIIQIGATEEVEAGNPGSDSPTDKEEPEDNEIDPGWINDSDQRDDETAGYTNGEDDKKDTSKVTTEEPKEKSAKKKDVKIEDNEEKIDTEGIKGDKPNNNPKMGDEFKLALPIATIVFSTIALVVIFKGVYE